MAPRTHRGGTWPGRRDLLRIGAVTAVAMLLPGSGGAAEGSSSLLALLRADYRRRVEALADRLRPIFPVRDPGTVVAQAEAAQKVEAACRERLCRTATDARVVLAVSPSWDFADFALEDVRDTAAVMVACDVAWLLGARWYLDLRATEDERPNADRGVA